MDLSRLPDGVELDEHGHPYREKSGSGWQDVVGFLLSSLFITGIVLFILFIFD